VRPSTAILGVLALVITVVAVSGVAVGSSRLATPTHAIAASDHAVLVAVVDARSSASVADLIGLVALATFVTAAWGRAASLRRRHAHLTDNPLRRWRARLVGAPPLV
jgi:hypothetical protein